MYNLKYFTNHMIKVCVGFFFVFLLLLFKFQILIYHAIASVTFQFTDILGRPHLHSKVWCQF